MTDSSDNNCIFTIGHSDHDVEKFCDFLIRHAITAVADVRSQPYSFRNPQFNRELLKQSLRQKSIDYVFLGNELGARRSEQECYVNGVARYEYIAKLPLFYEGLARLRRGAEKCRIALMCAEKDPLTCHRTILVCRHLRSTELAIQHILHDGTIETNEAAEERLLKLVRLPQTHLFTERDALVEQAYDMQGEKIAFTVSPNNQADSTQDAMDG